jgi:hypothetical protein
MPEQRLKPGSCTGAESGSGQGHPPNWVRPKSATACATSALAFMKKAPCCAKGSSKERPCSSSFAEVLSKSMTVLACSSRANDGRKCARQSLLTCQYGNAALTIPFAKSARQYPSRTRRHADAPNSDSSRYLKCLMNKLVAQMVLMNSIYLVCQGPVIPAVCQQSA